MVELDFEMLFQACPGHFLVIAPDPPRFTILDGSQAYFDATNTSRDVIGMAAFDVFPDNPDDPTAAAANAALKSSLSIALSSKEPHQLGALKYDIPAKDGTFEERFWTVVNTPILDKTGQVRYLMHQSEDITEFVRLREQRTQLLSETERMEAEVFKRATLLSEANAELARLNEKLKRNDELKSQFFANVSHELRTPLTLILGPVERALSDGGLDSEQRRLLESVRQNARLLLKHVNDILEISTLEAGKVEPRYAQVNLGSLARQIAGNFESLAEVRNLSYRVVAPPELPAQVDPGKLQRIILNLLANAIKFTPAGGTVELTVRTDGETAELAIADSGPGIPERLRSRVFERFFQSEDSSTRRYGGTGLGLSIVREFVHLHGGTVEVGESASGGALFTVRLPLQAPAGVIVTAPAPGLVAEPDDGADLLVGHLPTQPVEPSPESETIERSATERRTLESWDHEPPRVLVVEDNPEMLAYVCASLQDYRTLRARDGRDGLEKALAQPPDLIVTDIMMPGMSGPQMLEQLRGHPTLDAVPVIILTARAEDDLRVKLLRMGAQDYLVKPFSAEELVSRVDNLIRVKRYRERLEEAYRELKSAQVQLVQSAKMASLGQLVAGIAHEINNPLAYATSNLYTVNKWVQELAPHALEAFPAELIPRWGKIQDRLSSSAEGIDRVKELVLKLRTFSRLDEGEFKEVDIPTSLDSVLSFLEHRMSGRITVERRYGPERLLECFPGALNQVVMNLLANAIEAIEDEGVITVATWCDDSTFTISVKDTGPGLPPEVQDRIFDPFFTTKPVGVGTGLGLSISFGIMQTHQGVIRTHNVPGGGCEFVLEIPRDLGRRLPPSILAPTSLEAGGKALDPN